MSRQRKNALQTIKNRISENTGFPRCLVEMVLEYKYTEEEKTDLARMTMSQHSQYENNNETSETRKARANLFRTKEEQAAFEQKNRLFLSDPIAAILDADSRHKNYEQLRYSTKLANEKEKRVNQLEERNPKNVKMKILQLRQRLTSWKLEKKMRESIQKEIRRLTDISRDQASKEAKESFKKDGGFSKREKHEKTVCGKCQRDKKSQESKKGKKGKKGGRLCTIKSCKFYNT